VTPQAEEENWERVAWVDLMCVESYVDWYILWFEFHTQCFSLFFIHYATPPQQSQWFPPRELTQRRNRLTKAWLVLWIISLPTKSKRGLACQNFSHSLSTEVSNLMRTFCVWPCVIIVVASLILVHLEEGKWLTLWENEPMVWLV
jgi:hypothetical protein